MHLLSSFQNFVDVSLYVVVSFPVFFFFFEVYALKNPFAVIFLKIIYLFIFGCVGSLFLCEGFL